MGSEKTALCIACDTPSPVRKDGAVGPCPSCGAITHTKHLEGSITPEGRLFRRARSPGKANYDFQHEEGHSFHRTTGRWHWLTRIIDRTRNWYLAHIVDAETGDLIRYKDEPLNLHKSKQDDAAHGDD